MAKMIFKRNKETEFLAWKKNKTRKPLLVTGARQVGKTSFLKEMGKIYYKNIAYFNFEEQKELNEIFENTKNIKRLLSSLSLICGFQIEKTKTLIFFDEIQESADALNVLKYFQEHEDNYHVVAAGSLLGVALSNKGFPVGKVSFMSLHPLTFEEFLFNTNADLYKIYLTHLPSKKIDKIPDLFFTQLMDCFKTYQITGGMPEVCSNWSDSNSIDEIEKTLKNLLNSIQMDFKKHTDDKTAIKIGHVWNSLPSQLARENKKFVYQIVKEGARAREYEDALLWLIQSNNVIKIPRTIKPELPLKAYEDLNAYKLYVHDVGILRALAQLKVEFLLYKNKLFTEFKGSLTENYIAQCLYSLFEKPCHYWVSEGQAEIDFIIEYKGNIFPIEVKSDVNIRSKSLAYYQVKYQPRVRIRYSASNISLKENLINIPFFYADKIKLFLDNVL